MVKVDNNDDDEVDDNAQNDRIDYSFPSTVKAFPSRLNVLGFAEGGIIIYQEVIPVERYLFPIHG